MSCKQRGPWTDKEKQEPPDWQEAAHFLSDKYPGSRQRKAGKVRNLLCPNVTCCSWCSHYNKISLTGKRHSSCTRVVTLLTWVRTKPLLPSGRWSWDENQGLRPPNSSSPSDCSAPSFACPSSPAEAAYKAEMAGWHHRPNGHEFEQAPGVGDGQGGLACCGPRGCKESDTTERLNHITGLPKKVRAAAPLRFCLLSLSGSVLAEVNSHFTFLAS